MLLLAGCGNAVTPNPGCRNGTGWVSDNSQNCGVEVTVDAPPTAPSAITSTRWRRCCALELQGLAGRYSSARTVRSLPRVHRRLRGHPGDFEQGCRPSSRSWRWTRISSTAATPCSAFDESTGRSRQAFADAGITAYASTRRTALGPIAGGRCLHRGADHRQAVRSARARRGRRRRDEGRPPRRSAREDGGGETAARSSTTAVIRTAFTAGGKGIGNQIIELAGATNVFSEIQEPFADVRGSRSSSATRSDRHLRLLRHPRSRTRRTCCAVAPSGRCAGRQERPVRGAHLQDAVLGVCAPARGRRSWPGSCTLTASSDLPEIAALSRRPSWRSPPCCWWP